MGTYTSTEVLILCPCCGAACCAEQPWSGATASHLRVAYHLNYREAPPHVGCPGSHTIVTLLVGTEHLNQAWGRLRASNPPVDQRASTWLKVFGGLKVPLQSLAPVMANVPGVGLRLVFLVDFDRLTPDSRARLVYHHADSANIPPEDVEADLRQRGCMLLAEGVDAFAEARWIL